MKICILGDCHMGARNDSIIFKQYFKKFYENVLFPKLKSEGITEVIQLGDFFDRRKYINFTTLDFIREVFFEPAAKQNINIVHLLGNHDVYYKNTLKINASTQLTEQYKHFHVIDKPTKLIYDNISFDIIPWICDENQQEIFDFISMSTSDILCGHLELSGYNMYPGIPAHGGLSDNIFSKYNTVFSGHYHTRSVNKNINYLGTPYEITWGDAHDKKGFAIFDTDTKTYEFIENPYCLHQKVIYDDLLTNYDNIDLNKLHNSFIKIIVSNKNNETMFNKFIDRIWGECSPYSLQITDLSLVMNNEDTQVKSIHNESPLSILLNQIVIDNDNDTIKNIAKTIYNEALQIGATE